MLEAVTDGNGNLTFRYANGEFTDRSKSSKTKDVKYELNAGAVDGKTFGVNWDNVKSVSGQTYDMKDDIKKRGFRWDGNSKRWVRK